MSIDTVKASTKIPDWVRSWQDWLWSNGPSLRSEIEKGLGKRATGPVTPFTILWSEDMVDYPDSTYSPTHIVRMEIHRPQPGRGGSPMVYLLWSQRHDALVQYPNRTNRKANRR